MKISKDAIKFFINITWPTVISLQIAEILWYCQWISPGDDLIVAWRKLKPFCFFFFLKNKLKQNTLKLHLSPAIKFILRKE